jgi:predicted methyltransferase
MHVADERRGGPSSMSADERAAFLATQPSGAICVIDDDGRLLVVPARILNEDAGILSVQVAGTDLASTFGRERQGCVVADAFESYDGIRGVIARGTAAHADVTASHQVVALTMTRVSTFTFADDPAP